MAEAAHQTTRAGLIDGGGPKARIGTSGWTYRGWRSGFYAGVPQKKWLPFCAERFTGIEVNATFYRTIKETTFERWRTETPDDFAFALKGSRFITHLRRLADPQESVERQRGDAVALGDKLAAMLWQLPKSLEKDMALISRFADALDRWPAARHTVEFRHESWFDDEVAQCLGAHRIAVCLSDAADWPLWDTVTTDFVYLRLHGHTRTYASAYGDDALRDWATRVRRWLRQGREVHVYFDNDVEGAAPYDAMRLMEMVARRRA